MDVHPTVGAGIGEANMISELRATIESLAAQLARLERDLRRDPATVNLQVRLLGPFEVRFGEQVIEGWRGRRPRLMFQYLAAHHPRPVHRDELIEAIWPGAAPDPARRNLHQATHAIRQIVREAGGPEPIALNGACYRLSPLLDIVVDATEYESLARRAAQEAGSARAAELIRRAIAIYKGDFLETEPYESWTESPRRHLSRIHLDLLEQHSRWLLDNGTATEAIAVCRTILRMEPTHESAHRRLMVAFARDGRTADAIRTYSHCRQSLEEELGLSPSQVTEHVYEQILRNEAV